MFTGCKAEDATKAVRLVEQVLDILDLDLLPRGVQVRDEAGEARIAIKDKRQKAPKGGCLVELEQLLGGDS